MESVVFISDADSGNDKSVVLIACVERIAVVTVLFVVDSIEFVADFLVILRVQIQIPPIVLYLFSAAF